MAKNVLIFLLLAGLVAMSWLAWRNAKPVCHDLQRQKDELVCVYYLGDKQEDNVDVLMAK